VKADELIDEKMTGYGGDTVAFQIDDPAIEKWFVREFKNPETYDLRGEEYYVLQNADFEYMMKQIDRKGWDGDAILIHESVKESRLSYELMSSETYKLKRFADTGFKGVKSRVSASDLEAVVLAAAKTAHNYQKDTYVVVTAYGAKYGFEGSKVQASTELQGGFKVTKDMELYRIKKVYESVDTCDCDFCGYAVQESGCDGKKCPNCGKGTLRSSKKLPGAKQGSIIRKDMSAAAPASTSTEGVGPQIEVNSIPDANEVRDILVGIGVSAEVRGYTVYPDYNNWRRLRTDAMVALARSAVDYKIRESMETKMKADELIDSKIKEAGGDGTGPPGGVGRGMGPGGGRRDGSGLGKGQGRPFMRGGRWAVDPSGKSGRFSNDPNTKQVCKQGEVWSQEQGKCIPAESTKAESLIDNEIIESSQQDRARAFADMVSKKFPNVDVSVKSIGDTFYVSADILDDSYDRKRVYNYMKQNMERFGGNDMDQTDSSVDVFLKESIKKFKMEKESADSLIDAKVEKKIEAGYGFNEIALTSPKGAFTKDMLDKLRNDYGKLNRVDPSKPAYKKLTDLLDGLTKEQLKQLVDAKIKFVSKLALNRYNRQKTSKESKAVVAMEIERKLLEVRYPDLETEINYELDKKWKDLTFLGLKKRDILKDRRWEDLIKEYTRRCFEEVHWGDGIRERMLNLIEEYVGSNYKAYADIVREYERRTEEYVNGLIEYYETDDFKEPYVYMLLNDYSVKEELKSLVQRMVNYGEIKGDDIGGFSELSNDECSAILDDIRMHMDDYLTMYINYRSGEYCLDAVGFGEQEECEVPQWAVLSVLEDKFYPDSKMGCIYRSLEGDGVAVTVSPKQMKKLVKGARKVRKESMKADAESLIKDKMEADETPHMRTAAKKMAKRAGHAGNKDVEDKFMRGMKKVKGKKKKESAEGLIEKKLSERDDDVVSALVKAGIQVDSHESDLYVKDTPEARKILKNFNLKSKPFRSQIDKEMWLDVPFAYTPFWQKKAKTARELGR